MGTGNRLRSLEPLHLDAHVPGTYYIAFWVQRSGGGEWTYDAVDQVQRTVNAPAPCTAGGLTSTPPGSNVALNTPVTFTATATCSGIPAYRWWVGQVVNGTINWSSPAGYAASNTFNWTPTVAGTYYIAYWVQNQGGGELDLRRHQPGGEDRPLELRLPRAEAIELLFKATPTTDVYGIGHRVAPCKRRR